MNVRAHARARACVTAGAASALLLITSGGAPAHAETLDLPGIIDRALDSGRTRARNHETSAAQAKAAEARAAAYPGATIEAFLGPSPEIRCVDAACVRTAPDEVRIDFDGLFGGVSIEARQPLYTFGKISAAGDAAGHGVRAARALEEATDAEIALEARRAYYGLLLARSLVALFEDAQVQVADAHERIAAALGAQSGEYTVTDRLRLEALQAEVDTRLIEARQGEREALAAIRALAGPEVTVADAPLVAVEFDLPDVAQFSHRSVDRRADLEAARAGASARRALAQLERRQLWPDLAIVGRVNLSAAQGVDDPPSVFANDPFNRSSVALGLGMRWALEPGQLARIDQAEAAAEQSAAQLDALGRGAGLEARRAIIRAMAARERMESTSRGERASRGWRASVVQAEAVGAAEARSLVDAYVSYFTMSASRLRAIHDWNVAVADIRRLSGAPPRAADEEQGRQ